MNQLVLPDSIASGIPEHLTKTPLEHFKDIAIAENDSDPQHLFFIGLAYLDGINVEADHEKALKLIQEAAEAGLEEAAEKLVSMHRLGEGAGRACSVAIVCRRNS